jgi:hypothetical protein
METHVTLQDQRFCTSAREEVFSCQFVSLIIAFLITVRQQPATSAGISLTLWSMWADVARHRVGL